MSDPRALYDGDALRRIEARVADAHGDAFELMRRAGAAAWRASLAAWPQAVRIVVSCGPGNNGGDGYAFAAHALQAGRDVRVVRLASHAPRSAQAQRAESEYVAAGGRIEVFEDRLPPADLLVDAVFGIGLARAPDEATAALLQAANAADAPCFALDVPSGVDADSGRVPGVAVRATRTLQFIAAHPGLATGDGLERAGERAVADLDVPAAAFDGLAPHAVSLGAAALARFLPARRRNTHKGENGRVLCIGGDHGHGGAILLCAEAALRAGAGLVDVATRAAHVPALLARRPEAMAQAVDDARALQPLLDAADVVAIGPGLGRDAWGRALHDAAFASGKPLIVDADALNILAEAPGMPVADMVLTPHPGEAARLLDCSARDVQDDRFAAMAALRDRFGCAVALKGAGTLVAAPGETVRVVDAGNPGMAVGGMGDVLTGVVAALRAQGLPAFNAASCGALLHACAGDAAALRGARGLLPSDLFPELRRLANP